VKQRKDGKLPRLSDFQWGSAVQYLKWLDGYLALEEINYSDVYSLRIGGGINPIQKIIKKKKKLLRKIMGNLDKLKGFVVDNRVADLELVVCTSAINTITSCEYIVRDQLETLGKMEEYHEEMIAAKAKQDAGGEIPF